MKNIERLTKYITKNGGKDMLIHVIPGTSNWLVCQKIETNKWSLTLMNPIGYVVHNLGTVDDEQHLKLWKELIEKEIEGKVNQIKTAQEIKKKIS